MDDRELDAQALHDERQAVRRERDYMALEIARLRRALTTIANMPGILRPDEVAL